MSCAWAVCSSCTTSVNFALWSNPAYLQRPMQRAKRHLGRVYAHHWLERRYKVSGALHKRRRGLCASDHSRARITAQLSERQWCHVHSPVVLTDFIEVAATICAFVIVNRPCSSVFGVLAAGSAFGVWYCTPWLRAAPLLATLIKVNPLFIGGWGSTVSIAHSFKAPKPCFIVGPLRPILFLFLFPT